MNEPQHTATILTIVRHLHSDDVVDILRRRFEIDRISKHFKVSDYTFSGTLLQLDHMNSIMMEFRTLQKEFPEHYTSESYKLLLILNLRDQKAFDDVLKLELQNISRKDNVDQIVLWTCEHLSPTILQALRNINTSVIYVTVQEITKVRFIDHFIPPSQRDYDYAVALNTIADLLLKRLKKLFHLVLSEVAAPIYNQLYGKTKFATSALMRFEEDLLQQLVRDLEVHGRTGKAIDVGCGTGRQTFVLAKRFKEVYAFDFSPRMIEQAKQEKRRKNITNIFFSVADLEYEEIIDESVFYGSTDLVWAGFGLASFVEDTPQLLRRFYNWMNEGSYLVMSLYNSQSLLLQATPNWRDSSLSAQLDVENNTLRVELSPTSVFHIYCKPFSNVILGALKSVFEVQQIYTYPTLMSLMPNSLLENPTAKDLFLYLDNHLASHPNFLLGYYVLIVAKKAKVDLRGYYKVKAMLDDLGSEYEMLEHSPVLSVEDVRMEIGYHHKGIVKTVVFQERPTGKFITVVLPAEKRVGKEQIAEALGVSKSRIVYAPEREVIKLGFPLGGIAPFCFNETLDVRRFVDGEVFRFTGKWLYMGVGDNRKTLKLKTADFWRIVSDYEKLAVL